MKKYLFLFFVAFFFFSLADVCAWSDVGTWDAGGGETYYIYSNCGVYASGNVCNMFCDQISPDPGGDKRLFAWLSVSSSVPFVGTVYGNTIEGVGQHLSLAAGAMGPNMAMKFVTQPGGTNSFGATLVADDPTVDVTSFCNGLAAGGSSFVTFMPQSRDKSSVSIASLMLGGVAALGFVIAAGMRFF